MEITIANKQVPMLPDNGQYKNRFEIKSESSNRLYVIAQNKKTNVWSCSCPGWIIHRKCKHLKAVESFTSQLGLIDNNVNRLK